MRMREKEEILKELTEINDIINRLAVHLEKDPADRYMLALFRDYLKKRKALLKMYEPVFGMLTMDCRDGETCRETCGDRRQGELKLGRIYFVWHG